jgi:hypothetical protein
MVAYPILTTRAPLSETVAVSCNGLLGTKPMDISLLSRESSSDVKRTMVPLSPTSMSLRDTRGTPASPHLPWHEPQDPSASGPLAQKTLVLTLERSLSIGWRLSDPSVILVMRDVFVISIVSDGRIGKPSSRFWTMRRMRLAD